ncbi:MAG: phytoene/squalene synthase family protein [Pseudomonadota bacterium]
MEAVRDPIPDDSSYQRHMLPRVSRTFALTVPQLPRPLDTMVGNAYLLCRVADTVEDDPELDAGDKRALHGLLMDAMESGAAAQRFARQAGTTLAPATPPDERDLALNLPRVARTTRALPRSDRQAIGRCLQRMCSGMDSFDERREPGTRDLADLQRYCHYVAGVVGEMLTELFCNHGTGMAPRRTEMRRYAESFGQGLQMTNILKDVWDDLEHGRCWLPRAEFEQAGYDFARLAPEHDRAVFNRVMTGLVALAHGQLRNALRYTEQIPTAEPGMRRFCLLSIGLALLTLKRIHDTPGYATGSEVKVSRRAVSAVLASARVAARFESGPATLVELWSRGLPLHSVAPSEVRA